MHALISTIGNYTVSLHSFAQGITYNRENKGAIGKISLPGCTPLLSKKGLGYALLTDSIKKIFIQHSTIYIKVDAENRKTLQLYTFSRCRIVREHTLYRNEII